VSQSIGDFFVKIGLKVDNQQKLTSLATRLNNASDAANDLVKNLNKLPAALAKLNIPIVIQKSGGSGSESASKSKEQYKQPIGPGLGQTQYSERAGPSIEHYKDYLKKKKEAESKAEKQGPSIELFKSDQKRKADAEKLLQNLNVKREKQQLTKQKADELQLKTNAKLFSQIAQGKGSLSDLASAFGAISVESAAVLGIFSGVAVGLGKISQYATKAGEEFFKFHLTTGLSIKSLQEWQFAAVRFGASGEDIVNSISSIQQAQTDIQLGQGNMAPWALLGINPNQNPVDVLSQIHDKIKEGGEISAAMGKKLTAQLGINDSTFQMLRRADLSVVQLKKDMLISSENTKAFDQVNQAMGLMEYKFGVVAQKIGTMLAPAAQGLANLLEDIADITLSVLDVFNDFDNSSFGKWLAKTMDLLDKFIDPFRIFNDVVRGAKEGTLNNSPFATGSAVNLNKSLPSNSSSSSNSTNNNNITVQISGAGDPHAIVKEMHKEISKGLFNSYGSVSDLSMIGSTAF
jgi:hypothetical protein